MEVSALRAEELDQWFDLLDLVFEDTPRQYFVRHWQNGTNATPLQLAPT